MNSFLTKTLSSVWLGLAMSSAALASDVLKTPEGFPDRPVTLLIGWGAGGGVDQFARQMAPEFERITGQPLVVVNKPGGRGTVVLADFMSAAPDGYTLLGGSDDMIGQYVAGGINEVPFEDWTPLVIPQVTFTQIYMQPNNGKFSDWGSFVEYAKAHPGEIRLSNSGPEGGAERVMATEIDQQLGIGWTQTQFDKAAERYGSLLGGHVDLLMEQPGDVSQHLEAGTMVPILSLLNERPASFGDVPSITDIGVKMRPFLKWRALWSKGDVPEDVKSYLESVFEQIYESKSFQDFNIAKYMNVVRSYYDTESAVDLMKSETEAFQRVLGEKAK